MRIAHNQIKTSNTNMFLSFLYKKNIKILGLKNSQPLTQKMQIISLILLHGYIEFCSFYFGIKKTMNFTQIKNQIARTKFQTPDNNDNYLFNYLLKNIIFEEFKTQNQLIELHHDYQEERRNGNKIAEVTQIKRAKRYR